MASPGAEDPLPTGVRSESDQAAGDRGADVVAGAETGGERSIVAAPPAGPPPKPRPRHRPPRVRRALRIYANSGGSSRPVGQTTHEGDILDDVLAMLENGASLIQHDSHVPSEPCVSNSGSTLGSQSFFPGKRKADLSSQKLPAIVDQVRGQLVLPFGPPRRPADLPAKSGRSSRMSRRTGSSYKPRPPEGCRSRRTVLRSLWWFSKFSFLDDKQLQVMGQPGTEQFTRKLREIVDQNQEAASPQRPHRPTRLMSRGSISSKDDGSSATAGA